MKLRSKVQVKCQFNISGIKQDTKAKNNQAIHQEQNLWQQDE